MTGTSHSLSSQFGRHSSNGRTSSADAHAHVHAPAASTVEYPIRSLTWTTSNQTKMDATPLLASEWKVAETLMPRFGAEAVRK